MRFTDHSLFLYDKVVMKNFQCEIETKVLFTTSVSGHFYLLVFVVVRKVRHNRTL